MLAFPSSPKASAGVFGFGQFQFCEKEGVGSGASLLRKIAVAIKFSRQEVVVLSEGRQASNDLIKTGVNLEEMLVDWQLHAQSPPSGHGLAWPVAWLMYGDLASDIILARPGAVAPSI